jgi:hypothetical protein
MTKEVDRWVQVTVDRSLTETVDKVIKEIKDEYGRLIYRSRAHFVDEAITEKLKTLEVPA